MNLRSIPKLAPILAGQLSQATHALRLPKYTPALASDKVGR